MNTATHTDAAPSSVPGAKPEWAMSRREIEAHLRAKAGLPPIGSRKKRMILMAIVILLLGVAAYLVSQREEEAPAPVETAEPADVVMQINADEYVEIAPQTLQQTVRLTGTLSPGDRATLSAEVGGLVEEITVETGDEVKTGDVLVRISAETLMIELDVARSTARATQVQLDLAQSELDRASTLLSRGVTTQSAVDQARSSVDGLRANLTAQEDQIRSAELRAQNAVIRAPFDGVVSSREVDPGEYIGVGTALVSVVDISTMLMDARAPLSTPSGTRVQPGMDVDVTVDGFAGLDVSGEVERVSPLTTEGTRMTQVFVRVDNPGVLLGGMFATGQAITENLEDAIAVPAAALLTDDQGVYVLRVVDGVIARADVDRGSAWPGDMVNILSGLSVGDVVISVPLPELSPGQPVDLTVG